MITSLHSLTLALTLAAACALGTSAAYAQTPTVINSLPYYITTKGLYVLTGDLASDRPGGNLINVNASNVTIDMQGHFISGPAGNTSQTTVGIGATERSNVTIKNGTVAYCRTGILIQGNGSANTNSVNHQVDNMRMTYCYYAGIVVDQGPGSRITNCQVSQTDFSAATGAVGIIIYGNGAIAQSNVVSTVTTGNGNAFGIYVGSGTSFVRQNVISNAANGIDGGMFQDNLAVNCAAPFASGVNAGGNVHN